MEERDEVKKTQQEKVKEITEKLHEGIKNLFNSDTYRNYLKTMSKFTNYSFNNTILIGLQRPDTQAVAGYKAWETKFHRTVKKGSKGIQILSPTPYTVKVQEAKRDALGNVLRDSDGKEIMEEVEKIRQAFKVAYVFAYEDTEGEPLPEIVSMLDKEVKDYDKLMDVLNEISPCPIHFVPINSTANGYYHLEKRSIYVKADLPQLQKVKTSVHEIAHAVLHDRISGEDIEATKREKEVCAESVAFVICEYLGLDTSDYSFGYIAGWSSGKELDELKQKMELIRKTADTIISGIEQKLVQQLTQSHMMEQEPVQNMSLDKSNQKSMHRGM